MILRFSLDLPHLKDNTLVNGFAQLVGHHDALVAMPNRLGLQVLLSSNSILGLFNVTVKFKKIIIPSISGDSSFARSV